jgi:hypothetical protein
MKRETEIEAFLRDGCIPRGDRYTLVIISVTKRYLGGKLPPAYRLLFLDRLEQMTTELHREWLTAEMIAAVEPACDQAYEIYREAMKLGAKKAIDVCADVFVAFASLNPSLLAALKISKQGAHGREIGGLS